jgi:hypothetical protein
MKRTLLHWKYFVAASLGATLFAVLAAAGHYPYAFYTLTRWVVFLVSCWGIYFALEKMPKPAALGYLIATIVFNPFIPFYFERDIWQLIDIVAAVMVAGFPFIFPSGTNEE